MLMGFGCTVPAVMGARTMENEKDRRMTILLVPFMSCGARLPIYGLMTAAVIRQRESVEQTHGADHRLLGDESRQQRHRCLYIRPRLFFCKNASVYAKGPGGDPPGPLRVKNNALRLF